MVFAYGIIYIISTACGFALPDIKVLFICALIGGFTLLEKYTKEKHIPLRLITAGTLVLVIVITLIKGNIIDYYRNFRIPGELDMTYGFIPVLLVAVLLTIIYKLLNKNKLIRIILIIGPIVGLIVSSINGFAWKVLPVAALMYVSLKAAFTEYQELKHKKINRILIIAVLIIASILPNRSKPISWDWLVTAWNEVKSGINELVCDIIYGDADEIFGVGNIGFSGRDTSFWGKITDSSNREMLRLKVYSGVVGTKYFTGIIKDSYEDNLWSPVSYDENISSGYDFELKAKLYNLYNANLPVDSKTYFAKTTDYVIEYMNLHTDTVFIPANCIQIEPKNYHGELQDDSANLIFTKKQRRKDKYMVRGLLFNQDNETFVQYLKDKKQGDTPKDENTLFTECANSLGLDDAGIWQIRSQDMAAQVKDYENYIKKLDLQVPDTIPEEVYDLAEDITKGCNSDYEKTMAIISYLKDNEDYVYSKDPDEAIDGMDETTYFLLEGKKGFCGYFASGATILLRCAGVPARFVEGAAVNDDVGNYISVIGSDAHAWTQAYIEGYGWLDVDATPGYDIAKGSFIRYTGDSGINGQPDYGHSENDNNLEVNSSTDTSYNKTGWKQVIVYVASGFAGLIIIAFLSLIILLIRKRYLYQHANNGIKCEICMRRIFHLLEKRKSGIKTDETLRNYAKRISNDDILYEFGTVLSWYEKIRYAGYPVSDAEIRWLEELMSRRRIIK